MEITAFSPDGEHISIDQFFSKHDEFADNWDLAMETRHVLKVLTHCNDPGLFATRCQNGYSVFLDGKEREYVLTFGIIKNTVVLISLE